MEFTSIHTKRMGQNPAQVNRGTGELFINPDVWPYLPESFKSWILLHEEGHLKGGPGGEPTADELLADKYAFEHFVGTEKESLRKSVKILHDSLPKHSEQQWKRIITMYARALEYDYRKNGNKEALEELERLNYELQGYVNVSNEPFFQTEKSNWVTAVMGLLGSIFTSGVSIFSNSAAARQNSVLELQNQTMQSESMADEYIYGETINGVDKTIIYGLVILVISVGFGLYLKTYINK